MKKEIKKQIERKDKEKANYKWIIRITLLAFIISVGFSFLSELVIPNVNVFLAILILIIFISVGVLFDMIGVAVTAANEKPFHSMSSRKISGAKTAVKFKKNADKVSSFCNDVIGDICGIISGSVGVAISLDLASKLNISLVISTLFVTGVIAGLTVGGKAIGKTIAINNSNEILYRFAKVLSCFEKK